MTNLRNSESISNPEQGVALLFCLFALLILTAVTASLITLSSSETSINANYRTEEQAFFAAKTGIYEALDRMQQSNASTINCNIPSGLPGTAQPVPTGCASAPAGVLYIINAGSSLTVHPWSTTNTYFDDELCHEGYTIAGMSSAPPDVPCTTAPTGSSWYSTVTSNYPWSGTSAAMPYEWVRINWKPNNAQSYLTSTTTGGVTTTSTSTYSVNGTGAATTPVCWNGSNQVLLAAGDTNCGQMQTGTPPTADTPVYLVTALAITPNGSRQMVQTEVAIPPPLVVATPGDPLYPDGFFSASNTCSSSGGSTPFNLSAVTVDGYDTSSGGTYASTHSNSLGSIGSNGSVLLSGGTTVGGKIHVLHTAVNGTCAGSPPSDIFTSGGGTTYGGVAAITSPYIPVVPTIPAAGTTDETIGSNTTLAPGSYKNITVSGSGVTLTLTAPGTYNINCITLSGGAILTISPATKQVVVNVVGTSCTGSTPINLSGGSVANSSGIAANLIVNYAGTQQVKLSGGSSTYIVANVPNAPAILSGGSHLYGAIIASTIGDTGGTALHFDNALASAPSSGTTTASTFNSSYQSMSFRSLPY